MTMGINLLRKYMRHSTPPEFYHCVRCQTVLAGRLKLNTTTVVLRTLLGVMPLQQQGQCKFMKPSDKFLYGYSRDHKGRIINYHRVFISNTVHTSTGSGGNTDQFAVMVYET